MPKRARKLISTKSDEAPVAPSPPPVDPECVEQTLVWIIEGAKEFDIRQSIAHHWPEQSIEAILLAVTARLTQATQVPPDLYRGMCIEATLHLHAKMLAMNDLVGSLRAIKQLWEMTR